VQTQSSTSLTSLALIAAVATFVPLFSSQATAVRRSKSDRDINAIGHRDIIHGKERPFITSLDREKELGAQYLAQFERSAKLVRDPEITNYLSALAQKIGHNSDAQMPIRVIIVDNNTGNACTSPGGYQYLTRGLLVQMETEGELAAVLAHGVAQTALHLPSRQQVRQALLTVVESVPATIQVFTCTSMSSLPITSGVLPRDEFDADYFGVQYLYKSGYDPECYLRFVQRIWPTGSTKVPVTFSWFPPTLQRLKALRSEVGDILPPRGQSVISTSAFDDFQAHLHNLPAPPPEPDQPVLIRPASEE
jgi:predicted Zn-dependent protease